MDAEDRVDQAEKKVERLEVEIIALKRELFAANARSQKVVDLCGRNNDSNDTDRLVGQQELAYACM